MKKKVTNVDFRDQTFFDDLKNSNSENNESIMLIFYKTYKKKLIEIKFI